MYLDTVGKVTVGAGLMLPTAQSATALPFQYDGRPADTQEIIVDFRRVSSMVKGKAAGFYRSPMSVLLTSAEIDVQLRASVTHLDQDLRKGIPTWDALPAPAKLALLDMAYNLGMTGLLQGYPKLLHAIVAGDWKTAAAECLRNGPSPARNEWTRQQFLACTTAPSITAEAELRRDARPAAIVPIEPLAPSVKTRPKTTVVSDKSGPTRNKKPAVSGAKLATGKPAARKPAKKAAKSSAMKKALVTAKKTARKSPSRSD
ncbi:lysozyme family protein [Terriglobus albidus]|uniref:hypothetical protein n=1 Tax=Terriglobus albidus TaxID=1592106 RepID=UPI0021DF47DF|nr:hypothetical protein [Terriglobus albidus]